MNGSGSGSSSLYRCIVVSLYRFLEVAYNANTTLNAHLKILHFIHVSVLQRVIV